MRCGNLLSSDEGFFSDEDLDNLTVLDDFEEWRKALEENKEYYKDYLDRLEEERKEKKRIVQTYYNSGDWEAL